MTRINVIPVQELTRLHLQGELKEITRVFGIARKNQYEFLRGKVKIPSEYVLGTGHVLHFIDKLKFIADRYEQLCNEMRARGYKPNQIAREELLKGIDTKMQKDYIPTQAAIELNKQRIEERLNKR